MPNLARLLGPLGGLEGPIRSPGPMVRQLQGPLKLTVGTYRASPCIVHTFDRVLRTNQLTYGKKAKEKSSKITYLSLTQKLPHQRPSPSSRPELLQQSKVLSSLV